MTTTGNGEAIAQRCMVDTKSMKEGSPLIESQMNHWGGRGQKGKECRPEGGQKWTRRGSNVGQKGARSEPEGKGM